LTAESPLMEKIHFDYIIIGAGAAGLHLAHAMLDDSWFQHKRILIIDKDTKTVNDRTWCFWEKGNGKWDDISHKIWEKGWFHTMNHSIELSMYPYRYKMVRGIDFYNFGRNRVSASGNIEWITGEVNQVNEHSVSGAEVICGDAVFSASYVFDSRIDPAFQDAKDGSSYVLQHFLGWFIETEKDVFSQDEFVMMDYRIKWKNETGFTYVLPSGPRKALVEFTLFTPSLISKEGYEAMLKKYLADILNAGDFTVTETEYGIIPMTDYPFHKHHDSSVIKIGTAGGWVKPSSGYSFKNAERYSRKVISNIKSGNHPAKGVAKGRFRKYDMLFLDILQNRNELGEGIFTDMYLKNPASQIFKFLDEETSIAEDLKIISSFKPAPFQKALFRNWNKMI
jgi:lycopene beta-cyclase